MALQIHYFLFRNAVHLNSHLWISGYSKEYSTLTGLWGLYVLRSSKGKFQGSHHFRWNNSGYKIYN